MLKKLAQYYQIFCNLSLDVVGGVFFCMLPLPLCFYVEMPVIWYITLPACVWIIYLLDHVVDVVRKEKEYPTPRHRFIKKHLPFVIVLLIVLCAATGLGVSLNPDKVLFVCGGLLSLLVILHLLIVRINPEGKSLLNNKEMAIAIIYSLGIYIGPLAKLYDHHMALLPPLFSYSMFFIITCINLLMASLIEYDYDEQMSNSSWVRVISKKRAEVFFSALVMIAFAAGFMIMPFVEARVRLLLFTYIIIALGHVIIYRSRISLTPFLAYRKLAELLFWLPGALYFLIP